MNALACLMHWYISMLYVVPVLAVGGWGWWSSKRVSRGGGPKGPKGSGGAGAGTARSTAPSTTLESPRVHA
jgi:hypothetical protein